MTTFRIQPAFFLALLGSAACSGGDPALEDTGVKLNFALCGDTGDDVCPNDSGGDPGDPGDPADPEATSIDCGVIMVRDVRLDEGPDDTSFDERVWEPIDLFDPASSAINLLDVAPGSYERVRFKVEPLEGFVPGPSGRKVSFFFCGEADGVVWEYRDDSYETIELRSDVAFEVAPDRLTDLAVTLDTTGWFDGIDFASLKPAEDGVVYIDEAHHYDLQQTIRERIRASIDLVRQD